MQPKVANNIESHCLICGGKSEGANSGVDSCRACSAFFRRTVKDNMKYTCKAENKCDLSRGNGQPEHTRICRSCRFERCLNIGMLPEEVNSSVRHSSSDRDTPGPSQTVIEDDEFLKTNTSRIPLLAKVASLYHLSRSRRFYSELELLPKSLKKPKRADPVEAHQLQPCDVVLGDNMWRSNLRFITEFCDDTFEEFSILEKSDKFDLFRSFVATLFIYELEEASAMHNLEKENKRQISRTTYIDYGRPDLFWSNREPTADNKFLETWAETCSTPMHHRYFASFRDLKPTVIERAAIVALLFWNIDDLDMCISEETLTLCNEVRSRIMHELHVYYTEILIKENYSLRLGKVLDHLHETNAHARGMRTELLMYVMIGAMKPETTFFDLIRV
ncbi:hypothetical protein PRIPAC_82102 [Pristionchus pacificus]|nr:hypothetical protein PRIPAC_82102 [Pristionchus pacificus]